MSEAFLERLSRFTPDASGLNRDVLLVAAGRNSVRPNRGWVTVASLLAASQALSLAVLWQRPHPTTGPSTRSIAAEHLEPAIEQPGFVPFPSAPFLLSTHHGLLDADLETRPADDVTFIDQGPPLRAVAPLPASLLN